MVVAGGVLQADTEQRGRRGLGVDWGSWGAEGAGEVPLDCGDWLKCEASCGRVSAARGCRTDRDLSGHAGQWGDRLAAMRKGTQANGGAPRNSLRPGEGFARRDRAILPSASRDVLPLRQQASGGRGAPARAGSSPHGARVFALGRADAAAGPANGPGRAGAAAATAQGAVEERGRIGGLGRPDVAVSG